MLRLGIVGCGRVTTMFHLTAIREVEELSLAAVVDRHRSRMEEVRTRCGTEKGYTDYMELLSDPEVDAVVINTPPDLHEEMVIQALMAGKHVLCEKPLTTSVEGAIRIKKAQEDTGLVVLPAHNYAFTPCLEEVRELIHGDAVGDILKISISFGNSLRIYRSKTNFRLEDRFGIVEDVLPHILSVTSGLAGATDEIVDSRAWKRSHNVIDNMSLRLRTEKGAELDCLMSWTKLIPSFRVDLLGSSGGLEMDLIRSPFHFSIDSDGVKRKIGENKGLKLYLDLLRYRHPSFQNQYRHLCRLVEGKEPPRITIDDEIEIIQVIGRVVHHLSETDKTIGLGL